MTFEHQGCEQFEGEETDSLLNRIIIILFSKKYFSLAPLLTITQAAEICGVKKNCFCMAEWSGSPRFGINR